MSNFKLFGEGIEDMPSRCGDKLLDFVAVANAPTDDGVEYSTEPVIRKRKRIGKFMKVGMIALAIILSPAGGAEVSTAASYKFNVTADITLTANFDSKSN